MDASEWIAENIIRDAIDRGVFDNLAGQGQPLVLSSDPFQDPLAPTLGRILRDNGATHPLIEGRRALDDERDHQRERLRRAWTLRRQGGPEAAWDQAVAKFREEAAALNRDIRLNNLRAPIANFQVCLQDIDAVLQSVIKSGE